MATFKFFFHDTDIFEPEELEFQMQSIPVGSHSSQTTQVLQPLIRTLAIAEPGLEVTVVACHLRPTTGKNLILSYILSVSAQDHVGYEIVGCCIVEA